VVYQHVNFEHDPVSGWRTNWVLQFRTRLDWVLKKTLPDQTKLITAFKSLIRVIFGYELDRIKYLDSITGLGSDLIT